MARRKAARPRKSARNVKKRARARRSAKRPTAKRKTSLKAKARKPARRAVAKAAPKGKVPRLDRARRTLDDIVPTPPSSLNLDRHGSAARTGRAELNENLREHRGMTDVSAGDLDVDVEDAFFTGEEAPGGDNPTPDQDVVDDIGKALGVEYEDNEELKSADKLEKRDKHRWELDPASAEDYKDRK
jgi:uncharacterized protein DUF6335